MHATGLALSEYLKLISSITLGRSIPSEGEEQEKKQNEDDNKIATIKRNTLGHNSLGIKMKIEEGIIKV